MTTAEKLLKVEETVLGQLEPGKPVSMDEVFERVEEHVGLAELRKAVWSLVAKGRVALTSEFRLVRPGN